MTSPCKLIINNTGKITYYTDILCDEKSSNIGYIKDECRIFFHSKRIFHTGNSIFDGSILDKYGYYWMYGNLHRIDGPAVESKCYNIWFLNGIIHRADGPAYENFFDKKTKQWWIDGKLHRLDGPAIVDESGRKEYYINSKKLTEDEFNKK